MHRGTRVIDWLFRSRATGKLVIVQVPNVPLVIFFVAAAVRWLLDPTGTLRGVLDVVATVGLAWWAIDELVRGVNPWRRALGGVVLISQLLALVG